MCFFVMICCRKHQFKDVPLQPKFRTSELKKIQELKSMAADIITLQEAVVLGEFLMRKKSHILRSNMY